MEKKYELTEEIMCQDGRTLYRIRALKDFELVRAGDIGGWIESEDNLSHEGECWVFDNGMVYDNGWVADNGRVFDNGIVCENGRVCDNGWIFGHSVVCDNGWICGNGWIFGHGRVTKKEDIIVVESIGSRGGSITFFRCEDGNINVSYSCFRGTISEFAEVVKKTYGDNKYAKEYELAIELAKLHMEVEEENKQ